VFSSNDPAVVSIVQQDVTRALAQWEPSLTVLSVSPAAGQDPTQGQAVVNVDYQIAAQPGQPGAGVQTATVLVGGDVIIDG
jgi:phage baseplate assembly protein W